MRRKQLFMIALTGALVTGSVPGTVWAAENGVEATSEEGSPAVDAGEDTTEEPSEPAATEAPAEPTEAPATEAPAEPQNTEPAEEPVATEEAQEDAGTETEEDSGITIGEQKFATLKEAVAYAKANPASGNQAVVINVNKAQEISETITVDESCKVNIVATDADVKFTRAAGFTGNMFAVTGENAVLQLNKVDEEGTTAQPLAVDGTTESTEGVKTLVSVSDSGTFEMYSGVSLSGNKTSGDEGGAITNKGGLLLLAGGTITGNTGSKGGVYSDASVGVQGDIQITENKGEKDATANLYLDGSDPTMVVMGTVAESAKLNFSLATVPEAGKSVTVAKIGTKEDSSDLVTAEEFKTAVGKMAYDAASDEFELVALSSDGKTAVLKKKEASTPDDPKKAGTGEVGVPKYDSSTKKVTFNIKGTEDFTYYVAPFPIGESEKTVLSKFDKKKATNKAKKDTKTSVTYDNYDKTTDLWVYFQWPDGSVSCEKEVLFLPTISGVTWTDHNTVQFKLAANHPFHYYYTVTKSSTTSAEAKAAYDASKAKTKVSANEKKQLTVSKIPDGSDFQIWVYFKMNDGTMKYSKIPISTDKRPGKSTDTRDPYPHTINDCKVSGLEEALKFYPGVFYEFSVTGAGTEITNPVTGDEKYEPLYWSTSKTPTDAQKNKSWKIGSAKGITDASTYNMYIFFQKYRYNGSEWIAGDIEYKTVQFKAAEITEDDLNNWKKENGVTITPEGGSEGSGSGGSGTDAELTATAAAQNSSSSSKSAVSTADESPIGTMSALMALSLLAGGYVLIRKRKKEDL